MIFKKKKKKKKLYILRNDGELRNDVVKVDFIVVSVNY